MTEKQRRIYHIIADFIERKKYPPTVREIGRLAGLRSSATVWKHLSNLEQLGYLKITKKKYRAIKLLKDDKGKLI